MRGSKGLGLLELFLSSLRVNELGLLFAVPAFLWGWKPKTEAFIHPSWEPNESGAPCQTEATISDENKAPTCRHHGWVGSGGIESLHQDQSKRRHPKKVFYYQNKGGLRGVLGMHLRAGHRFHRWEAGRGDVQWPGDELSGNTNIRTKTAHVYAFPVLQIGQETSGKTLTTETVPETESPEESPETEAPEAPFAEKLWEQSCRES